MPQCCGPLPPLSASENHTVLFVPVILPGKAPEAFPDTFEDKWDYDHVQMPCSSHNIIKITEQDGNEKEINAWEVITTAFSKPISSVKELLDAVSTYSKLYGYNETLIRLDSVVEKVFTEEGRKRFFDCTLPKIIKLALQLPTICTQAIPLLKSGKEHSITISQKQISCILANAFLGTFPRQSQSTYNSIRFNLLSSVNVSEPFRDQRPVEKIKCLLNYFRRVTAEEPTGTVTFRRKRLTEPPDWSSSTNTLSGLWVRANGTTENEGADMQQVDFADKYVRGMLLTSDCAQEEVLFILSPELVTAMLFTEKLADNETLLITGCEKYNRYSGYQRTFQWEGDYHDRTPRDSWGRKYTQMVAMDAQRSFGRNEYQQSAVQRELNRAYCGFHEVDTQSENLPAIASGKWGCGIFIGTKLLKSLIQLMAASEAKRDLVLYTFGGHELEDDLLSLYYIFISKNITVGKLWNLLMAYSDEVCLIIAAQIFMSSSVKKSKDKWI